MTELGGTLHPLSEFDLGKFNTIQHGIATGANRLVKQRIRRTPLGFAEEEEAQLKKMLGAGVIRRIGIQFGIPYIPG
jgi:hypothetical protein